MGFTFSTTEGNFANGFQSTELYMSWISIDNWKSVQMTWYEDSPCNKGFDLQVIHIYKLVAFTTWYNKWYNYMQTEALFVWKGEKII